MKGFGLLILFLLNGLASTAVDIFKGRVVNHQTHKTLPFANIGILHKNRGTCANFKGNYILDLTGVKDSDTLVCSQNGFTPASRASSLLVLPLFF